MPLVVSTSGQGTYRCVLNGYVVWFAFLLPMVTMPPVNNKNSDHSPNTGKWGSVNARVVCPLDFPFH